MNKRPPSVGDEFFDLLDSRTRIVLAVIVDALMLLVGGGVVWGLQRLGERLALHGVAYWYWLAVEIILSVASVLSVLFFVVNDLRRLFRRLFPKEGRQ